MISTMEKSKNFCIDALLSHSVEAKVDLSGASHSGISSIRSPVTSPSSHHGSDTPPPHPKPTNSSPAQHCALAKGALFGAPQTGIAALQQAGLLGMHHGSMFHLAALGGQQQPLIYPGFTQLVHPYPEQLKGAALAASLPLEHWIRAGMMVPRVGEFGGEPHVISFKAKSTFSFHNYQLKINLFYLFIYFRKNLYLFGVFTILS